MASIGTVDVSGLWKIQHRKFQEYGLINGDSRLGDRNETYPLDDFPVLWNGSIQDSVGGALDQLYEIDGRWFQSLTGRFLSEDPAGVTGGQTNLYLLNGNDPYAKLNKNSVDWSKLEGPEPFSGILGNTVGRATYAVFGDSLANASDLQLAVGVGIASMAIVGTGWYLGGGALVSSYGAAVAKVGFVGAGVGFAAGAANGIASTYASSQLSDTNPEWSGYVTSGIFAGATGALTPFDAVASLAGGGSRRYTQVSLQRYEICALFD